MNPTIKRLIFSLLSAAAVFSLIAFLQQALAGPAASVATFIVIFLGTAVVALLPRTVATRARSHTPKAAGTSDSDTETGTVKWFNVKKGYGFITRDSGDDVFVHYRNIVGSGRRAISDGQRVQFIVIDGDKGLQADEVEAI